jgi:ProP effector
MSNSKETIGATLAELTRQFPAAFSAEPAHVKPLKIGILRDIYAQSVVSHRRLAAAVRSYCNSVPYLKVSKEGAARFDLAGEPAGAVTAAEAESARNRLTTRAEAAAKPLGKTPTGSDADQPKPAPAHMPPGPKRLSLDDLKRAAAARKPSR